MDTAYMPARASGPVSSRTRRPASRPSPSTEMTMKSCGEMLAWSGSLNLENWGMRGAKYFCARSFEHTTEHSSGVMEMLRNGCWLAQGTEGRYLWEVMPLEANSCSLSGYRSCSSGCTYEA